MDQTEFENAIKDYVVKVVDKENNQLVTYKIARQFRKQLIDRTGNDRTRKKFERPANPVVTPDGVFDNVKDAAAHYKVASATIYNWIAKSKKQEEKEFYLYEERTKD